MSAFEYSGRAAQAVQRLKFARATSLAAFMATKVFEVACTSDLINGRVVVPVPIHWTRRCWRGFNQSEMLTESFPPEIVRRLLLARVRATRPQVGLSGVERQSNLKGAFGVTTEVAGQRVLLVDDVVTTGHTARECARALLDAGALEVGIVAFAGEC